MRRLWISLSAFLLLSASAAFAGNPALIPSQEEQTISHDPPEAVPFTPDFMRLPRVVVPLTAGPAGQYGSLALPAFQSESSVASSGSFVVVGNNDERGAFGLGIMRSTDGGATFTDVGQLSLPSGYLSSGDPAITVWNPPTGPPVFYCATLATLPSASHAIVLYRSTDGGATWAGPFEVSPATVPGDFPDRESIVADPETGRLLIAWTHFSAAVTIRVTYSDNAATGVPPTWSAAAIVGARPQDGQATTIIANPLTSDVYLAWMTFPGGPSRDIAFARSSSNGTSWPAPADIGPAFPGHQCPYGFDRWLWSFSGNSIAFNRGDGGIEMVYAASVDGTPGADFGDIYYRRSVNGGATWSAAVPLNVFPGADRPQANPCVSVADNGRIDVMWYDQSAGSGRSDLTDLFYCYSGNFGASWSSPVPLTSEPFHCESGNDFGAPHQGDYNDFDGSRLGGGSFAAAAVFAPPAAITTGADPFAFTGAGVQVAPLRVRPGSIVVLDRGCGADDGVLVAAETADLVIPLENIGRGPLGGISTTLTALTPGVNVEPGAHGYGVLASGASGTSPDVYRLGLVTSYPCGVACRFRLDITATGVAPTFVEFSLPTGVVVSSTVLLDENFDSILAPALPAGWFTQSGEPTTSPWRTTTTSPASGPNALFAPEVAALTFERINAPLLAVPAGTDLVEVTFDLQYSLAEFDANYAADAVTFDFRLDEAGSSHFSPGAASEISYRYNHNVYRGSGESGDRWGWSGSQLAYVPVRMVLPGLASHSFRPRWHVTTAGFGGGGGAWVDNVKVRALTLGCGACVPTTDVRETVRRPAFEVAGANPFRSGTLLRYVIPELCAVRIELFDVTGNRVRTLVDERQGPGTYSLALESRRGSTQRLAPGIYLARLTAGQVTRTLRLVAIE